MTLINQRTHISSEVDEKTFINAELSNGVLIFTVKDFYHNEIVDPIRLDLKSIKLRIKKTTIAHLNELKSSTRPADIQERETNLFLTPLEGTGEEGVWREHIWVEDTKEFEVIGSTRLDLNNYLLKAKVMDNLTTDSFSSSDPTALSAHQGKVLKGLVDGKAPIYHASANDTYGVSSTSLYGHAKTYNSIPPEISLSAGSKGTTATEFAMGNHTHKHPSATAYTGKPTENLNPSFGDVITISQVSSNNTGHVSSISDRNITIPSNLGNGTKKGLTTNDYTTAEKTRVGNIESICNDLILEMLTEFANRMEDD